MNVEHCWASSCESQHSADLMHNLCTNKLGTKFCEFAQLDLTVLWIRASTRTYDRQAHTWKLNQLNRGAHSGLPQLIWEIIVSLFMTPCKCGLLSIHKLDTNWSTLCTMTIHMKISATHFHNNSNGDSTSLPHRFVLFCSFYIIIFSYWPVTAAVLLGPVGLVDELVAI